MCQGMYVFQNILPFVISPQTELFLVSKSRAWPPLSVSPMVIFECAYEYHRCTSCKGMGRNLGVELELDRENGRILNEDAVEWDGGIHDFRH